MTSGTDVTAHLDSIRRALREHYPALHAFINGRGLIEIAGAFPVRGADEKELDRFDVALVLPQGFPKELPEVRETSGRIPWKADRHVEPDGKACVIFPDDRWRCFPDGSTVLDYLRGPVHNYFLSQTYWEEHGEWPLGEWDHGELGILEYYRWLVGTEDNLTACRFLHILGKLNLKGHWECPCGSGAKVNDCCKAKIVDLRAKIPPAVARHSYAKLGLNMTPYDGPRLREGGSRAGSKRRSRRRST